MRANVRRTWLRKLLVSWTAAAMLFAIAGRAEAEPRHVRLQLKWYHQFQFAGYYAARLKGLYQAAGLDVEIIEGAPDRPAVEKVVQGQAEFGVDDGGDLLYARLHGAPVIALAVVFQHSPYVILSLKESGIRTPTDLIGRVMMDESHGASPLLAMLMREGIQASAQGGPHAVTVRPHTWRVEDLLEHRVDAMSAYLTEEPLRLGRRGIEVQILRPVDYGIDFYGDALFTSESMLQSDPDMVDLFRAASMRGWEYAMTHVVELTDHIMSLQTGNANRMSRELVLDEAGVMQGMVMPTLVELGHMNPGRWERMAEDFKHVGAVSDTSRVAGFIPDPMAAERKRQALLKPLGWGLGGVLLLAVASLVWVQQLRSMVKQRTAALEKEIALREARTRELAKLAAAMDHAAEDMIITDAENVIQYVNPAFESTTGFRRQEVVGKRTSVLASGKHDPEFYRELYATLARGEAWQGRFTNRAKDGRLILQDATIVAIRDAEGHTTGYVSARRDVTRQVELETQFEQSQRMQAIGTLAGGIAHDFNNVLAGVIGYTGLALAQKGNPETTIAHLKEVQRAAHRAAALTKQILAFSRGLPDDARPVSIRSLLEESLKLVRATIPSSIDVQLNSSTEATVRVAPGDLERIVINLCSNASLAIGPTPGHIRVGLEDSTLDAAAGELLGGLKPGHYVVLSIADNGCGMTPEVKQHLFEPFFTTRKSGEGTGLGLSVVHGIVKSRGGAIQVQSEPNNGARFDIWLPVAEPHEPEPEAEETVLATGTGRLMLVDDEDMITSVFQQALQDCGYEVAVFNSSTDALRAFEQSPEAFDLIITDLAMPKLRGDELARRIKGLRTDVRVLLCTGNDAGLDPGAVDRACVDQVLRKPLSIEQMASAVQSALHQSREAS